jgi:hypothetical protein
MPKQLEEKLGREAEKHGYKKGTEHYNAYVYGTLKMIEHNKAGGPEKVFEGKNKNPFKGGLKGGDKMRVHPKVGGVPIGIVIAILLVLWYFFQKNGGMVMVSSASPAQVNPFVPTSPYPGWANYTGWKNTQYNQLGAYAGALTGQSD